MRIDMDTCEEILITITRNKTRSLLTAFGVFWGIFMLVALIGGGQGLEGMMKKNFEGFATNSGFLAAQKTGEAYKGFRKGRWWNLEAIDIERLRSQVKDVEVITPSIARWGSKAVYEDKKYDCSVKGLYPEYLHIESQEMPTAGLSMKWIYRKRVKCVSSESVSMKACSNRERILAENTYVWTEFIIR